MTPSNPIVAACICGKPDCPIRYGLCHCECEGATPIATITSRRAGNIKGQPQRYIMGHQLRHDRPCFDDAAPFKIEGVYCKLIPLTKGQFAIVDEADYARLASRDWFAWWNPSTKTYYAERTQFLGNNKKINVFMHRQILELEKGDRRLSDHENGATLDNRRRNLRIANRMQNGANSKLRSNNKSGYKGVSWDKRGNLWVARIQVNRRTIHLGSFESKEAAAAAYRAAALLYFGEFASF